MGFTEILASIPTNAVLKVQLETLKREHEAEIEGWKTKYATLETDNADLRVQLEEKDANIKRLQDELDKLKRPKLKMTDIPPIVVAGPHPKQLKR